MIAMSSIPSTDDTFIARTIEGETILINDKGDMLHTLNRTGSFIWARVDGAKSLRDILGLLCAEYDIAEERAEEDIRAFVEELQRKGIVRIRTE
jgi:hypothetical protein